MLQINHLPKYLIHLILGQAGLLHRLLQDVDCYLVVAWSCMRWVHLFDGELLAALGEQLLDDVDDDLAAGLDTRQALVRKMVGQPLYQGGREGEQDQWRRVHAEAERCMHATLVMHGQIIYFYVLRAIGGWEAVGHLMSPGSLERRNLSTLSAHDKVCDKRCEESSLNSLHQVRIGLISLNEEDGLEDPTELFIFCSGNACIMRVVYLKLYNMHRNIARPRSMKIRCNLSFAISNTCNER